MYVFLLLLGCSLCYGRSKYFPETLSQAKGILAQYRFGITVAGYSCLCLAIYGFTAHYGWGTGLVIYFMSLSLAYCLLLIALPLHKYYLYLMASIGILAIFIENLP